MMDVRDDSAKVLSAWLCLEGQALVAIALSEVYVLSWDIKTVDKEGLRIDRGFAEGIMWKVIVDEFEGKLLSARNLKSKYFFFSNTL